MTYRGRWTALVASAGTVLFVPLVVRGLDGCYSAVPNDGLVDAAIAPVDVKLPEAAAESGFVGPSDAGCDGGAGVIPGPTCFGKALSCPANPMGPCSLGSASMCGEPSCLPMTNNTPPLYNFRMEALHIVAPAKLASGLIATVVVTPAVTLNAPACGYGAWTPDSGSLAGAFNWLISVDKSTNTVTTGGGIPVDDPYSTGYSFLNGTYGGIDVAPRCSPVTFVGSRFSTKPSDEILNVPIFPTVSNTTAPIILPIRGAEFSDVAISPDGNCIGDLNPEWAASIGSMCSSAPLTSCPKWFTSGSLAGYITLDDADNVGVLALGLSLCSLLQGLPSQACGAPLGPTYQCCTAPEKTMGDYCSTGGGKGCTDSVWLSATFAANAVKIDKSSAPACAP